MEKLLKKSQREYINQMEKIILKKLSEIDSIAKSKEIQRLSDEIWDCVANIDIMLEYNIDKDFGRLNDEHFMNPIILEDDEANYVIQIDKGHPINHNNDKN